VLLIILLVFFVVFTLIVLLMMASSGSKTSKQTQATLASIIKVSRPATREEVVDVRKEHRLSSIPWLHELLSRVNLAVELRRILNQADLNWTPGRLMLVSAAVALVSGFLLYMRTKSPGISALLAILPGSLPFLYVWRKRQRRLTQIQQRLPETLDLMVSALRAGQSMGGALGAAAREAPEPIGREFRLCFEEQNFGIDLRTAMENLLERVPLDDMHIVTTAMLIHKESGGNLAEVLDKTSYVIRERFRLQQQIKVHTAQGRISGLVLMLLTPTLTLILYTINPTYIQVLLTRPVGHKILATAAVMNVIGLLLIRKIVNIKI
jgi:tight adherence protein B